MPSLISPATQRYRGSIRPVGMERAARTPVQATHTVRYNARTDQARADTEGARSIVDRLRHAARAQVLAEARREAPLFAALIVLLAQLPLWLAVLG